MSLKYCGLVIEDYNSQNGLETLKVELKKPVQTSKLHWVHLDVVIALVVNLQKNIFKVPL